MTGLLPRVAVINVACHCGVVASDVSPRLFLREQTFPEHITPQTASRVQCLRQTEEEQLWAPLCLRLIG